MTTNGGADQPFDQEAARARVKAIVAAEDGWPLLFRGREPLTARDAVVLERGSGPWRVWVNTERGASGHDAAAFETEAEALDYMLETSLRLGRESRAMVEAAAIRRAEWLRERARAEEVPRDEQAR